MIRFALAIALATTAFASEAIGRTIVLPTATTDNYVLQGGRFAGTAGQPATLVSFDVFSSVAATTVFTRFDRTVIGSVSAGQTVSFAPNVALLADYRGNWFGHLTVETSRGITVTATFSNIVVELGDNFEGVPEPATWACMLAGFGLLGAAARRPNRRLARS